MQILSNLRQVMDERNITAKELRARTGLGSQAIGSLRGRVVKRVDVSVLQKLCDALNITSLDELFNLIPDDIWGPIKASGEVTIHWGSRPIAEPRPRQRGEAVWLRQVAGAWDVRAREEIEAHLYRQCPGIRIQGREHGSGFRHGFDPTFHDSVASVFERGNHIVLGSPISNDFAERVLSRAYGVSPYSPTMRDHFPCGFVWDSDRSVRSSFGWQGIGDEFGIALTRNSRLIARQTAVRGGDGEDCALVLVLRLPEPPVRRQEGSGAERVIIALLGHTGLGTLAAARAAMSSGSGAVLFPPERGKPHMTVVAARYTRAPTDSPIDNRELSGLRLVRLPNSGTNGPSGRRMPARRKRTKGNGNTPLASGE